MSLLEALIWLIRLPFDAGRQLDEESLVGQSEWDRRSRKFWRSFAWIMTAILVSISLAFTLLLLG